MIRIFFDKSPNTVRSPESLARNFQKITRKFTYIAIVFYEWQRSGFLFDSWGSGLWLTAGGCTEGGMDGAGFEGGTAQGLLVSQ
jgi:hypothetical protein